MTNLDAIIYFKLGMDKNSQGIAFGSYPAFDDEEIAYFITDEMYKAVNTKLTGHNVLSQDFESSIKRIADLQKLVRTQKNVVATKTSGTNEVVLNNFSNNNTRMFYVSSILKTTSNDATAIRYDVQLVDHQNARRFKKTRYNAPWIDTPVAVFENDTIVFYVDSQTAETPTTYYVDLTYIAKPTEIDPTLPSKEITDFPEHVMREIINNAVDAALENIESQRFQTKAQLNSIQE